jgi:prepilin-type N-terminal cleavage/methylation domain-containing protein
MKNYSYPVNALQKEFTPLERRVSGSNCHERAALLYKHSSLTGFTLVELMVSLAIFSIVMVICTGTLLTLIDVNAKAQALNSSTTNLSFALDSMTREIRTGYHYYCLDLPPGNQPLPDPNSTNDCNGVGNTGDFISFVREKDGWQIGYRLNNSRIEQKVENPFGPLGDTGWLPITAENVVVEIFSLSVNNATPFTGNNTHQPFVDFLIKGYVNNGLDTNTDFYIQTHVVQRRLDVI